jgi:hypothetical protein
MQDLEIKEIECFSCGALVSDIEGPVHEYMRSAPGCWELLETMQRELFHLPGGNLNLSFSYAVYLSAPAHQYIERSD